MFAVCTATEDTLDATNGCVCAANYYETGKDSQNLPLCASCPTGSSTQSQTNAQGIAECGKYA